MKNILFLGLLSGLFIIHPANATTISDISKKECDKMIKTGVISNSAPVQCSRLKKVTFRYVDFSGETHDDGKIVVFDAVAPHVAAIFTSFYQLKFPISQAKPIEFYQGNDLISMEKNNTSAFNYRPIAGQKNLSLHAYGLAIDINPIQNPFLEFLPSKIITVKPTAGTKHINRMQSRFDKIAQQGLAEQVIDIFAKNGFQYWGGYWDTPIDYQHFQVSRDMAKTMTAMSAANASLFFKNNIRWYQQCQRFYPLAYKQRRFNDYAFFLKKTLKSASLYGAYTQNSKNTLRLINKKISPSNICVSP